MDNSSRRNHRIGSDEPELSQGGESSPESCNSDHALELLRKTEALARAGGWTYDIAADTLAVTEGFRHLFGIPDGATLTLADSYECYHPDDRGDLIEAFERCRDAGDGYDLELRIVTPDGQIHWVHERGERETVDGRSVVRGAVYDITDLKQRERDLARSERRYRRLAENLPNGGVLQFDGDLRYQLAHGKGLESIGPSPDEYVGSHVTEVFDGAVADRVCALYESTLDGEEVATEMEYAGRTFRVNTVPLIDETDEAYAGMVLTQDITEIRRSVETVAGINELARDLLSLETDTEIAAEAVDAGFDLFGPSVVAVYLYDDEAEALTPVAYTGEMIGEIRELPRFDPGEGIAWEVFVAGEPAVFADVRTADAVYNPSTDIRSELILPLGRHGVVLIGSTETDVYGDFDEQVAEAYASTVEAALDRAEQTAILHAHRHELERTTARLHRIGQLNDELRSVTRALIRASSTDEVLQAVCDSIAAVDLFDAAWVGQPSRGDGELEVVADAGSNRGFIETLQLSLETANDVPAVRAFTEETIVYEPTVADSPGGSPWRTAALVHEVRSIYSVPLGHNGVTYGVLSIHARRPDAFDERTRSVLAEVCELVGYALKAIEQRRALLSDEAVHRRIDISGVSGSVVELARAIDAPLRLESVIPRADGAHLIHVWCEGVSAEHVTAMATATHAISEVEVLIPGEVMLVQLVVTGPCQVDELAALGANLRSVTIEGDRITVHVTVPRELDGDVLIEQLVALDDSFEVLISHERHPRAPSVGFSALDEVLTKRQRDILSTAFFGGYFETPRPRTGADLAERLGISQPSFSKQLRTAQRNLFTTLFDDQRRRRATD